MALAKFELVHRKSDGRWHFTGDQKSFVNKSDGVMHVKKFGSKHGNCSVRIKKADGTIQEVRTYGKDRILEPVGSSVSPIRAKLRDAVERYYKKHPL